MRLRSLVFFAGIALALPSCGGGVNENDWILQFEDPTTRTNAVATIVSIRQGTTCAGTVIYNAEVRAVGGTMRMRPPILPPGAYSLTADARDMTCNRIGTGCRQITLPTEGPVVLAVETVTSMPACDPVSQICDGNATCDPRPTMMDGGIDAGPDFDAGTDAGPTPCTPEDSRCPSGGICHMGACCEGCWTGSACAVGTEPASCGAPDGMCTACAAGNACRDAACVDATSSAQFSLSAVNSFVRRPDGTVYGAGSNASMQLGPRGGAMPTDGTRFAPYSGMERFAQIASSQLGTCGLTNDGLIYYWGRIGASPAMGTPTQLSTDTFNQLDAGNSHFCAIRSDGRLFCFGDNSAGQLGTGAMFASMVPAPVVSTATWVRVAGGNLHTCGIQSDGSLWCWGSDATQQLGNGAAMTMANSPQRVGLENAWVEVSTGVAHTCAIKTDGSLWCWGEGASLRLGLGADTSRRADPTRVGTLTGWTNIAAGQEHSCGVRSGEGFCWGFGARGALGIAPAALPQPDDQPTPASIGMGWTRISAGWRHTCGVRSGGLFCWGENTDGRVGVGDTTVHYTPTSIPVP